MNRLLTLMLIGSPLLTSFGCGRRIAESIPGSQSAGPLNIYVDNYPVAYFTERIAGDLAKVTLPVSPKRDPAYYKPDAETIGKIQSSDLVILNGADYSRWPTTVSLSPRKVLDTAEPFKDKLITIEDAVVHSHGPEGEHSHAGLASNTWLDPELATLQARAIADRLKQVLGEKAVGVDDRLAALEADLNALGGRFRSIVEKDPTKPLLASHPVYDYLARYCGWNLKSLHWEPDETPSEEGWKELEKLQEAHKAQWLIWEGQPLESIVQRLNGMGINSVVFEIGANRPDSGDYLSVMNANLDQLERVYSQDPDGPPPTP